jgi:hypothetical protein
MAGTRDNHHPGGTYQGVIMSAVIRTASPSVESQTSAHVAYASVAFGRARGYYRLLFDAGPVDVTKFAALTGLTERAAQEWLEEQIAAGVLRIVDAPSGERDELLLPGEYVPILLADSGEAEFDGARALLDQHRADLPRVLAGFETTRISGAV